MYSTKSVHLLASFPSLNIWILSINVFFICCITKSLLTFYFLKKNKFLLCQMLYITAPTTAAITSFLNLLHHLRLILISVVMRSCCVMCAPVHSFTPSHTIIAHVHCKRKCCAYSGLFSLHNPHAPSAQGTHMPMILSFVNCFFCTANHNINMCLSCIILFQIKSAIFHFSLSPTS